MTTASPSPLTEIGERDRRHAALRDEMRAHELKVLLIAARGDGCSRGRLTYLANISNFVEPCAVVMLPLDGEPVLFVDPVRIYALDDWIPDVRSTFDRGKDVADCISAMGLANGRIGTVGFDDSITLKDWRSLSSGLPNAIFENSDHIYEAVTSQKTSAEVEALRRSAALAQTAANLLENILRPGVLPANLIAEAHRSLREGGCKDAAVAFSRRPFRGLGCRRGGWLIGGTAPDPDPISPDDLIVIEMDVAGPEGYWIELRRRYRFRKYDDDERRFWDMRHEAFNTALSLMKDGSESADFEHAINGIYRSHGYENRGQVSFHAHGTGVNAVEAPTCPGSPRTLKSGMTIVLHPLLYLERAESRAVGDLAPADVVLVTKAGPVTIVDQDHKLTVIDD